MMNNTLPLMDINHSMSLVYKVYSIEHDPKLVEFEIALIDEHNNSQFKHMLYEEDLIVLNLLHTLNEGEYRFTEPSLYITINTMHETSIEISIHLDIFSDDNSASHNAHQTYNMTIEKQGFIQFIDYLKYHLAQ